MKQRWWECGENNCQGQSARTRSLRGCFYNTTIGKRRSASFEKQIKEKRETPGCRALERSMSIEAWRGHMMRRSSVERQARGLQGLEVRVMEQRQHRETAW